MNILGIGSANFGIKYGLNSSRSIRKSEIKKIFKYLNSSKKKYFIDTSPNYGNAECLIGKNIREKKNFKIITKTISSKKKLLIKNLFMN